MKKSILQPMIADESVIVQFTDTVVFDKAIAVTVSNGYTAYVFADEKAQFRIEPCSEKKIVSYGKELLGKNGRIAFVRTKPLPDLLLKTEQPALGGVFAVQKERGEIVRATHPLDVSHPEARRPCRERTVERHAEEQEHRNTQSRPNIVHRKGRRREHELRYKPRQGAECTEALRICLGCLLRPLEQRTEEGLLRLGIEDGRRLVRPCPVERRPAA